MGNVRYDVSDVPEGLASSDAATPNQLKYINDLMADRVMSDEARAKAEGMLKAGIHRTLASEWITRLKQLPRASSQFARVGESLPDVPDGRYAISHKEVTEGVLKFYKIKKPTEGKWAGFVFVDAGRGGSHGDLSWTPIKNLAYKKQVLDIIAKDPKLAGERFGREVGACYKCGRSLTDETSRALGIGPDCRQMVGY
jgi:hypothetical protein